MGPDDVRALQGAAFVLFTVLAAVCAVTTAVRAADLRRRGIGIPILLVRDVITFALLALPFALILGVRATGRGPMVADSIVWTVVTSVPAITALVIFLAFEAFVVGRRR